MPAIASLEDLRAAQKPLRYALCAMLYALGKWRRIGWKNVCGAPMGKAYHENSVLSTEISMCSRIQLEVPKWNLKCIQPGSNLLMSFFSFSTPSKPLSLSPLQNKVRRKVQGVQTKNTHTLFRKARNNYPLSPFNWSGVRSCNHNLQTFFHPIRRHFLNAAFSSPKSFASRRSFCAAFKSSRDAIAGMVYPYNREP